MAGLAKVKASTQEHLDIEDVADDLVILKTGWVALVLSLTAVNFDLLSEAEQDATIYAYGALLNSLTFPVEVLIRSKKADITAYFASLSEAERTQPNPDLKRQIQKYLDFIESTVQQKTVLDKKFYVIINFSPLELGFKNITSRKPTKNRSKLQLIADAKIALLPKRDHLIKQMARLGLSARQLTTQELIELFYDIYNPAPTGTQRVLLDTSSYTTPIVEPAVEIPTPAPMPVASGQDGTRPSVAPAGDQLPANSSRALDATLRPVPPRLQTTEPETTLQSQSEAAGGQQFLGVNPAPQPAPMPAPTLGERGEPARQANGTIPTIQAEALKNLQEATAKATQLVNQQVKQPVTGVVDNPNKT